MFDFVIFLVPPPASEKNPGWEEDDPFGPFEGGVSEHQRIEGRVISEALAKHITLELDAPDRYDYGPKERKEGERLKCWFRDEEKQPLELSCSRSEEAKR